MEKTSIQRFYKLSWELERLDLYVQESVYIVRNLEQVLKADIAAYKAALRNKGSDPEYIMAARTDVKLTKDALDLAKDDVEQLQRRRRYILDERLSDDLEFL